MLNSEKLIDRLLLSKKFYKNLSAKRSILYLGVLLIGLIDLLSFDAKATILKVFVEKTPSVMAYNIPLFIVFIILLGTFDMVFFVIPLYDIFNFFREKKDESQPEGIKVKLMKVYIIAHLITLPANIIMVLIIEYLGAGISLGQAYFLQMVAMGVLIWFAAVIARGTNALFTLKNTHTWIVFPVVILWSMLLSFALSFALNNWVMMLFK